MHSLVIAAAMESECKILCSEDNSILITSLGAS